jgi:hypothetical protein
MSLNKIQKKKKKKKNFIKKIKANPPRVIEELNGFLSLANPKSEIFRIFRPFFPCTKILSDLISLN